MRFFFRSRQFRVILSIFSAVIVIAVIFGVIGTTLAPQANLFGTITAPFQSAVTAVSDAVSDFFKAYSDGNALTLKNIELESEISELREQIADYDSVKAENEFYKNYLDIHDRNPDFKYCPATVISRDGDDPYGGFVINKGTMTGVKAYDPVITEAGLVGYITEAGLTTSKITTVLSADLTAGALDSRTNDSGIVAGNLELARDGKTKLYNLSRSCSVAIGDYVITSGEGIFPDGLLIGKIESIGSDKYNTSIYADIKTFANPFEVREVMVITSFDGQGGVSVGGDSQ